MQPQTDKTIYRTKGDTDPVVFELKINRDGVTTKVPSTANAVLKIKTDTLYEINGTSSTNGIFLFSVTSVNTANIDVAKFEVSVTDVYSYVLGTGVIYFADQLT